MHDTVPLYFSRKLCHLMTLTVLATKSNAFFGLKLRIFLSIGIFSINSLLLAKQELYDNTVLAVIPDVHLRGSSTQQALFSAQKKAGIIDVNLAVEWARSNIANGMRVDDVRYYGEALTILNAVDMSKRNDLEYISTRSETLSLLHRFDEAQKLLKLILQKDMKRDDIRQRLFYLQLLQGELNAAALHCKSENGFQNNFLRELCAIHVDVVRNKIEKSDSWAKLEKLTRSNLEEVKFWAHDIVLDFRFIKALSQRDSKSKQIEDFLTFSKTYKELFSQDRTRTSYLADRLIMLKHFSEVLTLVESSTKSFPLLVRRLYALQKTTKRSRWSDKDRENLKFVLGVIGNEVDREQIDHGREGALIVGVVEGQWQEARSFAKKNWKIHREWIDLFILKDIERESQESQFSGEILNWSQQENVELLPL